MPAVNYPSPAPAPDADPTQAVRLLEMELARARARRLLREQSGDHSRLAVRALCVFLLFALMAGGFYAFWRAQELRGEIRRAVPVPASTTAPAKRP